MDMLRPVRSLERGLDPPSHQGPSARARPVSFLSLYRSDIAWNPSRLNEFSPICMRLWALCPLRGMGVFSSSGFIGKD